MCGAARGTPTAALQVDTGEPPLQLRRLQLQLQHAVKVKSVKDHPAANVFQPHWINRTRKYDENTDPVYNKIAGYISGIEIIKHKSTIPISDPPWLRKKSKVNLSVSECGLKQENPTLMCAVAK